MLTHESKSVLCGLKFQQLCRNCIEGLWEVRGLHVHCKGGDISKTVQSKDVTTDH